MKKTPHLHVGTFVSLILFAFTVSASDVYVSSTGTATAPYDSWSTAFTSVQAAFDYAQTNAVVSNIYLKGETFAAPADGTKVYTLTNRTGLMISGGYEGAGSPGARDKELWPTVLARGDMETYGRVLDLAGLSDVTFDGVTICNGGSLAYTVVVLGAGVRVANSAGGVVFSSCVVTNNTSAGGQGGAFYISSSAVTLTNCLVAGNYASRYNDGTQAFGGAAYLGASAVLNIYESTITNNTAHSARTQPSNGGAFYLDASTSTLNVRESTITDNAATTEWSGGTGRGGAIYSNNGKILLRNVLIARNLTSLTGTDSSSGIMTAGSTAYALLESCTVADNDADKVGSVGLRCTAGTFAVTNSIVSGHTTDLVGFNYDHVGYSNISDGQNAGLNGCNSVNPQFADTLYYHLKSTASHYTDGAFSGGSWTTSPESSPLIDQGDPDSEYAREPAPNGGRINMGAYGNTEVASQTPTIAATLPTIENLGVSFRSHTAALLRANLSDDGGQLPEVAFHYWEMGTSPTSTVSAGIRDEGVIEWTESGLASGKTYGYRVSASNSAGTTWSPIIEFSTLPLNATIYVSSAGDNTDAATWATAYDNVNQAFSVAQPGDTIRIAGETFAAAPGFALSYVYILNGASDILVEGGYEAAGATPGPRDPARWPTILARKTTSPTAEARVLQLENLANVTFDGLVFRDGRWNGGGGARVTDSSGVIFNNCAFISNQAGPGNPALGGGLYVGTSDVEARNCTFANNSMHTIYSYNTVQGAGIFIDKGGALAVSNSVIEGNTAVSGRNNPAEGGAIFVNASGSLDLNESVVTNNRVTSNPYGTSAYYSRGGGLANVGGTVRLRNVLIARNTSTLTTDPSSGIYSTGITALDNCTVVSNDTGKVEAVGVRYNGGTLSVTNSIVWGHAAGDLSNFPVDGTTLLNVGYSLFNDATMDGVAGCVSADPLFVAPADGEYQLGEGSPAIDAGKMLPWMLFATDLAGVKRAQGLSVDMGAYEVPGPSATVIILR